MRRVCLLLVCGVQSAKMKGGKLKPLSDDGENELPDNQQVLAGVYSQGDGGLEVKVKASEVTYKKIGANKGPIFWKIQYSFFNINS